MNFLELKNISFNYPNSKVNCRLANINMKVLEGQCVTIIGKSGSGKSTLLKLIEGRLQAENGKILYNNSIKPKYTIATVLQHYSLFPHLTVLQNILLPLRKSEKLYLRLRKNNRMTHEARKLLKIVKMEDFERSYPHELSGGQKQRIAIAQALAQKAELLLMDEPFGAVDEETRGELQDLLKVLQIKLGLTILLVTHDMEEALYLSQNIYLLKKTDKNLFSLSSYSVIGAINAIPEIKQSESFFKELQSLKASFYRKDSIDNNKSIKINALQRGIIDEAILVSIESKAKDILIISKDLKQDMDNPLINDVVVENLKRKVIYTYIVPKNNSLAQKNYERMLRNFDDFKVYFNKIELPESNPVFYLGEVVVYNLTTANPLAFSYLGGEGNSLLYKLPDFFIKQFVKKGLECGKH